MFCQVRLRFVPSNFLATIIKSFTSNYLSVLLSLHAVNCYILLTANLDDMHSLAKQIAESPVANQINDIIRRAATIIKETGVPVKKLTRKADMPPTDSQLDQMNDTDVGAPLAKEGEPQTNGDQDKVEKTDQHQPEIEKPDQNQPEIEKPDQNQPEIEKPDQNQPEIEKPDQNQPEIKKPDQNRPEIEKTDQNSAEGQEVAGNSDTESENKNQNIEPWKPGQEDSAAEVNGKALHSSSKVSEETNRIKPDDSSRRDVGFAELGRNASYYLNSIKRIFENI